MSDENMATAFAVKTDVFEGPLDLLLNLVEKRKLFINDVSLASVADEYVAHVKKFEDFPVAEAAQFIVVASTLVLIKSRSLLPGVKISEEEEGDIEDLERRLSEYQKMRNLSRHILDRFGVHKMHKASQRQVGAPMFSPDKNTTISRIVISMQEVLKNLPKKELIPKTIVQKVISLEEMTARLIERIKQSLTTSFTDFANIGKAEKIEIVVGFLAMLELIKQGSIAVRQSGRFEEIIMESEEVEVPAYV